jgi:integrase
MRARSRKATASSPWCNWLVKNKRLLVSPVDALTKYTAATDVRHQRRALTISELQSLVESARHSGSRIQGYGPEVRARLYEIAFCTGLRRNEIASLTPKSFHLAGPRPTFQLAAKDSKNRKASVLPLHPRLQYVLPEWLRGLRPTDRLFPGLAGKKTWLMVRKDLERVGIPYETEDMLTSPSWLVVKLQRHRLAV